MCQNSEILLEDVLEEAYKTKSINIEVIDKFDLSVRTKNSLRRAGIFTFGEMVDFCEQYDIMSFYALVKYAHNKRPDWHRILCDCGAVYMREYLNSRKWSLENGFGSIVDPESGEKIL